MTTWSGHLSEKSAGPGASKYFFDGHPVNLPAHWVDFIPRHKEFEGEVVILPYERKPYLIRTSTGLSIEKEVDWGLLDTFSASPNRWASSIFGAVTIVLYFTGVAAQVAESAPLLDILLLGREGVFTIVVGGGFLALGLPGAYFFVQDRRAFRQIWAAYREEDVEMVPSQEQMWATKKRQMKYAVAMAVPVMTLFGWAYGVPVIGALLGVVSGIPIGYFTRAITPATVSVEEPKA